MQSHASAFKTLKSDLGNAKHERMLDSRIRGHKLELYEAAVGSLTRLAQHLASLRSSTRLQERLIRAIEEGRLSAELGTDQRFSTVSASALDRESLAGPAETKDSEIAGSVRLFMQFREISGAQMDILVVSLDLEDQLISRRSAMTHWR